MLGLLRSGRTANVPLTAALDQGLGANRRTESGDLWQRPAPGGATAKKPGVVRMLRIYRDYAHDGDISCGEFGSRNHLDIWRRQDLDHDGRAPVLLQVPGGAWMVGNKRGQAHPLMSHLAELGWVCVAINYRLSPRSTWPDQHRRRRARDRVADAGGGEERVQTEPDGDRRAVSQCLADHPRLCGRTAVLCAAWPQRLVDSGRVGTQLHDAAA